MFVLTSVSCRHLIWLWLTILIIKINVTQFKEIRNQMTYVKVIRSK